MSEAIGEMILPGTYIEVRSEGLIGAGGISTGNIGVAGTANRGPVDEVVILGSYAEALETFGSYDAYPGTEAAPALTLTRTLEQVFKGGGSTVYAVRMAKLGEGVQMKAMTWTVSDAGGALFTLTAKSPGTWAKDITVSLAGPGNTLPLQLVYKGAKESYPGPKAADLVRDIADGSRLVKVDGYQKTSAEKVPASVAAASAENAGGPDGAAVTGVEVAKGLEKLAPEAVNIVVVAGLTAKDIADEMLAHLEATENDGKERIGVVGASGDDLSKVADDASKAGSPRLILVTPGIVADDAASGAAVKLSAAYSAALVAGRLSTLAPHVSLTNKDVAVGDLTTHYSRAQQKQLLGNRALVLFRNLGFRVLKGITTDTGAFRPISVRRIVDYAKAGVRVGSNPYIGRLNNGRVRAALQATLDGFLSGMVLDEMLVGYELAVTATRQQEINGQAVVTLTLQPTFSIDYVKVIMTLG